MCRPVQKPSEFFSSCDGRSLTRTSVDLFSSSFGSFEPDKKDTRAERCASVNTDLLILLCVTFTVQLALAQNSPEEEAASEAQPCDLRLAIAARQEISYPASDLV